MARCAKPVEQANMRTSQPCELDLDHAGPCVNEAMPTSVSRRKRYEDRVADHEAQEAERALSGFQTEPVVVALDSMEGDADPDAEHNLHPTERKRRRELRQQALAEEAQQSYVAAAQEGHPAQAEQEQGVPVNDVMQFVAERVAGVLEPIHEKMLSAVMDDLFPPVHVYPLDERYGEEREHAKAILIEIENAEEVELDIEAVQAVCRALLALTTSEI